MTGATLTASNGMSIARASEADRQAVEDLQHAAYAENREMLGVEPMPLMADYKSVFRHHEIWVRRGSTPDAGLDAALILDTTRPNDILIWSISTSPVSQKLGLGFALLECAEERARQLGRDKIRLYTGQPLTHLIDWYTRNGFAIERIEELEDRTVVHMLKTLS